MADELDVAPAALLLAVHIKVCVALDSVGYEPPEGIALTDITWTELVHDAARVVDAGDSIDAVGAGFTAWLGWQAGVLVLRGVQDARVADYYRVAFGLLWRVPPAPVPRGG
jgi:hypothetical protein